MPGMARKHIAFYLLLSMLYVLASSPVLAAPTVPDTYIVQSGDTLWGIAKKYGISVNEISRINDLRDANSIKPGTKLVLKEQSASKEAAAVKPAAKPVATASPTTKPVATNGKPTTVTTTAKPVAAAKQVAKDTPAAKPTSAASTQQSKTYTVQSGDTIWSISRATGVPMNDLMKLNGLREDSILRLGTVLSLTATAGTSAKAPTKPETTTKATATRSEAPVPTLPMPQPQLVTPIGSVVVPLPIKTEIAVQGKVEEPEKQEQKGQIDPQWAANLRQNTGITEADIDPKTATQGAEKFVPQSSDSSNKVVPLAVANDAERAREALGKLKGGLSTGLPWPVTGRISSTFGRRWGRMHEGLDIAVPTGTPVRVVADGVVTFAGWSGGYGNLVVVSHGEGWETYYGHNSELRVKVGATVLRGDVIARSGSTGNSTGPHVHLEIRKDGAPLDPSRYLK